MENPFGGSIITLMLVVPLNHSNVLCFKDLLEDMASDQANWQKRIQCINLKHVGLRLG